LKKGRGYRRGRDYRSSRDCRSGRDRRSGRDCRRYSAWKKGVSGRIEKAIWIQ
jgi:hypothetical protein